MSAYYNEIDPFVAAWLRALMKRRQIPDGDVDTRSIRDVRPADLAGFTACHFFAGIGGWAYALRLAGWPDDRPVWTGSCPCQPFSAAGKGEGFTDARHLWPAWFRLIAECRPDVVFGEQVAGALAWLDLVHTDLERAGYAVGALDLGAPSVGAYHLRQRLYFVGHANGAGRETRLSVPGGTRARSREPSGAGVSDFVADPTRRGQRIHGRASGHAGHVDECVALEQLGHSASTRRQGDRLQPLSDRQERKGSCSHRGAAGPGATGFWSAADWIPCRDGKARPVEPGTFPLAHGLSARVGRLRGYGNAIVPDVAAAFIGAYLSLESPDSAPAVRKEPESPIVRHSRRRFR